MELLEAASLLTGFARLGLEPARELKGVWVGAVGSLTLRIGRLSGAAFGANQQCRLEIQKILLNK